VGSGVNLHTGPGIRGKNRKRNFPRRRPASPDLLHHIEGSGWVCRCRRRITGPTAVAVGGLGASGGSCFPLQTVPPPPTLGGKAPPATGPPPGGAQKGFPRLERGHFQTVVSQPRSAWLKRCAPWPLPNRLRRPRQTSLSRRRQGFRIPWVFNREEVEAFFAERFRLTTIGY